jgi:aconitate hydratase
MSRKDYFGTRVQFETGSGTAYAYSIEKLAEQGFPGIHSLPFSIKVLLESVLRECDNYVIEEADVKKVASYNAKEVGDVEIPFKPARVVLQDFTGVPAVVDLAALRSAMKRLGGDPKKINPVVPVDLVIDHSVQVDTFGSEFSFMFNTKKEFDFYY